MTTTDHRLHRQLRRPTPTGRFHVVVTIPRHRTGLKVIARYHFKGQVAADRYANEVDQHPTGVYEGHASPCDDPTCGDFNITDD